MMRFKTILQVLIAVTSFSSCGNGATADDPVESPNPVRISFHIVAAPQASTRSDVEKDFESYLDINDIRYLLYDADARFLQEITPTASTVASAEEYAIYEVTANITDSYFSSPKDHMVSFYILTLANHTPWGLTFPSPEKGQSIDALFDNGLILTGLPKQEQLIKPTDDGLPTRYFPMAGLQGFTVAGNMLLTTWDGLPYNLTRATGKSVNLLRALAKIEVADRIGISADSSSSSEQDDHYTLTSPHISGVELNGFFSAGRLLPAKANWTANSLFETQQSEAASPASAVSYRIPPVLNSDLTIGSSDGLSDYTVTFLPDSSSSLSGADTTPVFSAYIYEYSNAILSSSSLSYSPPYLTVTISGYDDKGQPASSVYPMRLSAYSGGSPLPGTELDALLRNHVYRFEISGVRQKLNASIRVEEMDKINSSIGFN